MSSDNRLVSVEDLPASLARTWRVLTDDDLLHHGGIVAIATVASGGLNYAYQLFMGRALGPEQFGAFGALFALFYLVNVLGRGIRFSVARFVSRFEDPRTASAFYRGALVRSLLVGVVIATLLVAASGPISRFLDVPVGLIAIVAVTLPPGLAITSNVGTFEGRQSFLALGSTKILKAGLKLLLGVFFVLSGFGLYGAFGGIVAGLILTLAVTTVFLHRELGRPIDSGPPVEYDQVYRFGLPAVLAGFCLTVPANADVIVVKHAFPAAEAGMYTAASVLGKVLVFLPMGISTALFPKVSADQANDGPQRHEELFRRALVYAGTIGGAGALAYWLAPVRIMRLFFGEAYVAGAPILRWYGLAIVPFVLAVVVLNFQLARDRMTFVYCFAVGSVLEIALIAVFHASMLQVVRIVLVTNVVLFGVGLAVVKLEQ